MPETLTITTPDGAFSAYVARPSAPSAPAIVVIQEIFGVNKVMRGIADWLAREGFVALCPDLFWRQEPRIQLTDQTDAEWARAFELFQGFDLEKGVADLDASIEILRRLEGCMGKVGVVGFCLGGRLAFLCATRTRADAAVGYYGVALEGHLKEPIRHPLMMHIATADEFVSKEEQAKVHAALDRHALARLHDYPGRDHAFARVGGKHYDKEAAELAHGRTLAFLRQHLA